MKIALQTLPTTIVLLAAGLLAGCSSRDQIVSYRVARPEPPHRMLGAIIPQGERAWFFKLSGANEAVAGQAQRFRSFIQSVRLDGDGEEASDPTWELPESWHQLPGEGMRFATIQVPGESETLELSVMALPLPPGDGVLSNVNRWRGQIGLAPIAADQMQETTDSIDLNAHAATLVNLVGKLGTGAPMAAPFASGGSASDQDAARRAHAAAGVDVPQPSSLTYEAPAEWKPDQLVISRGGISVRRDAAFRVTDASQEASITITNLPTASPVGSGDAVLANANRWRGQIGLQPLSGEELAAEKKTIDVDGAQSDYFRFVGPAQAVLGVIVERDGKAWFIKLQGDHDLAIKLQDQFEAFVRSIRF